jgi:hypothetical protein
MKLQGRITGKVYDSSLFRECKCEAGKECSFVLYVEDFEKWKEKGLMRAERWDDLVRLGLVTADIIVQDIVGRDGNYVIYVYYREDKKPPEDAVEYARRRNIKLIKLGD